MSGLSTQKLATPLNASSADGVRLSRAHSAASSVMSDVTPPPIRLQTKLTVNTPGDKYEQEADRVADIVMRMPEPTVQRECETCGGKSLTGGECPECNKKIQGLTGTLQRLSTQGDSAPEWRPHRLSAGYWVRRDHHCPPTLAPLWKLASVKISATCESTPTPSLQNRPLLYKLRRTRSESISRSVLGTPHQVIIAYWLMS